MISPYGAYITAEDICILHGALSGCRIKNPRSRNLKPNALSGKMHLRLWGNDQGKLSRAQASINKPYSEAIIISTRAMLEIGIDDMLGSYGAGC